MISSEANAGKMVERLEWIKRQFSFELPLGMYPNVVERVRGTPARLEDLVRFVPGEILTKRDGDKWSIQEIITHLADCELVFSVRCRWIAFEDHPTLVPFDQDKWELFHLDLDFNETDDLAEREPERLKAMIDEWWREAQAHKVLPLDDRFAPRFAENAKRFHGPRTKFVFHAGMGHVPTEVAPDVRSRTYTIEADARIDSPTTEGVLIAHGDMTCGYALYIKDNRLAYDMNIGGLHHLIVSE